MIYYNGSYIDDAALPIHTQNRAFKYGDGVFESCLLHEGRAPLLPYNFARLQRGMRMLKLRSPDFWDADHFTSIFSELAKAHSLNTARMKITVWRAGAGLYTPEQNDAELLVEIFPLEFPPFSTAPGTCRLGVYTETPRIIHPLSSCKTMNALPYVLAGLFARREAYDDVLLLNTEGGIADAISSNLFILRGQTLITTPPLNGGVAGTMQDWLCDHAGDLGYGITRMPLTPDDLYDASAILLTNAIQGIRGVTRFGQYSFDNKKALSLLEEARTVLFA